MIMVKKKKLTGGSMQRHRANTRPQAKVFQLRDEGGISAGAEGEKREN